MSLSANTVRFAKFGSGANPDSVARPPHILPALPTWRAWPPGRPTASCSHPRKAPLSGGVDFQTRYRLPAVKTVGIREFYSMIYGIPGTQRPPPPAPARKS